MEVSNFTEKLNKVDGIIHTIEEEVVVNDGVYNGTLQHDNINKSSFNIYTGSKLTGEKITNYFISTPSETPWKNTIKIFSTVTPVFISYETIGDQVEAEDINSLQDSIVATQEEINNYEESNNTRVSSAETRIETIEANKYDKNQVYTKEEVLQKISDLINGSPQTLDTLNEIAIALGNDPNFSTTIINLLGNKVDKVDGKQLSTEDYSSQEKTKLDGVQDNANNYVHPDKHPASMIEQDSAHRFVTDEVIAAIQTSVTDSVYQTATGTATVILLNIPTLVNGYAKTFIASASNGGVATTINGKPVYKPITTTPPNFVKDKAYTIWYNLIGDCFFIKASAEGNAVASHVLAGDTFSNYNDTGLVGTLDLSKLVTENIKNGVTINGVSGKSTVVDTQDAILIPEALLTGYSGYDDGVKKAGTMSNKSGITTTVCVHSNAMTVALDASDTRMGIVELPNASGGSGYIDSTSKIRAQLWGLIPSNIRAGQVIGQYPGYGNGYMAGTFTSDANATSDKILSGYSAYVNGNKVDGGIPVNPGLIGGTNHIQSGTGVTVGNYSPDGQKRIYIRPGSPGARQCIDGDVWITQLAGDLSTENIISGRSILGIGGTASIASLGGKQHTTGSFTLNSQATYTGTMPFNIGAIKINGVVLYFNGSMNINVNLTTCTVSGNTFTITSHSTSAIQCSYDIYEA